MDPMENLSAAGEITIFYSLTADGMAIILGQKKNILDIKIL